jgi:hypothetical protein
MGGVCVCGCVCGCVCVCVWWGGGGGEEGYGFLRTGRSDFGVVDDQQQSGTLRNYSIPTADVAGRCRGGGKRNRINGGTN